MDARSLEKPSFASLKSERRVFGVSSTIWDFVFGTIFNLKAEKEGKEKAKEMMFEKKRKDNLNPSFKK